MLANIIRRRAAPTDPTFTLRRILSSSAETEIDTRNPPAPGSGGRLVGCFIYSAIQCCTFLEFSLPAQRSGIRNVTVAIRLHLALQQLRGAGLRNQGSDSSKKNLTIYFSARHSPFKNLGATWEQKLRFSWLRPVCKLQKSKADHDLNLGLFTLRTRRSGVRVPPGAPYFQNSYEVQHAHAFPRCYHITTDSVKFGQRT